MKPTFRRDVYACIHPETYKYFLDPSCKKTVWSELEKHFGPARVIAGFGILEMSNHALLLRSTDRQNPVTVIRKSKCRPEDISELHRILRFQDS